VYESGSGLYPVPGFKVVEIVFSSVTQLVALMTMTMQHQHSNVTSANCTGLEKRKHRSW